MPRLRRTSQNDPGWTRRRAGKGFVYVDERGERLGPDDVQRCKDLVITPAWEDVWICRTRVGTSRRWARTTPGGGSTSTTRPGDRPPKDFQTWSATVLAAAALGSTDEAGETRASRKRAVSSAMKEVAEDLGNTPTLARSSYVDPHVLDAYDEGRTIEQATRRTDAGADERTAAPKRAVLKLLRES